MKNLVVYYSLSGNTEIVAKEIGRAAGGELRRISEVRPPKGAGIFFATVSGIFGGKSSLAPMDFSFHEYDNIFVGGPVWAGRSTPAINAFLDKADFTGKKVYLFLTQGGQSKPKGIFRSMAARVRSRGGTVAGSIYIRAAGKSSLSQVIVKPIDAWIKKIGVTAETK